MDRDIPAPTPKLSLWEALKSQTTDTPAPLDEWLPTKLSDQVPVVGYSCTIQAANREALIKVLARENIMHVCPFTGWTYVLDPIRLNNFGRRCQCGNRDCWVYQYTDRGAASQEHKGG